MILIGIEVTIRLFESASLKDKRKIIKSVLQKTQQRYKVSAAEVGEHDLLNLAELGFAVVSNDYHHARQVLTKVLNFIEAEYPVEITQVDWLD